MRRSFFVVAAVVLVLAACSSDKKTSTSNTSNSGAAASSSSNASGAQTVTVDVDSSRTKTTKLLFTAYFPNEITLHPGDTIDFSSHFNGEPHTVTFGTLVDQGLPKADPNSDTEPPELQKIPALLPQGPGDAVQASAQPCFLASGDPPASDACTKDQQKQPAFDGTQTYYNSGFLTDGAHFKMTLSKDLKPGTYNYFCALHREGMTGKITVVGADAKAQTADDVKKAADQQLADKESKLQSAAAAVKAGTLPPFIPTAEPNGVLAGGGSQDAQDGLVVAFGPETISAKVGDKVTWTIFGPHTVTFGATEALRAAIVKAPDGSVHLNPDSFAPAGGAGQPQGPPGGAPSSGPPGPPTPIDGGSYDGSGLHSSGVVLSFPPSLFSYSVTFTKAGSYEYACLVHPDMKGTVNVS